MSLPTPLAHAKWFVESERDFPADWSALSSPTVLVGLFASLALVAALTVLARGARLPALPAAERLGSFAPHVPALLRMTLGAGFIGLTVMGRIWVPSLHAEDLAAGWVLAALQGALGAWLIAGIRPAHAAWGVVAFTALVAVVVDPLAVVEAAHVPAIAAALPILSARPARRRGDAPAAATILRAGLGVGLIVVAFTEKLLVPGVTVAVLESHAELDLLQTLGVTSDPGAFVRLMGCVEVALGVLLITGALAPMVALGALVPFVGTLPAFGVTELVGHLPIYGILLGVGILAATGPARERRTRPALAEPARQLA